ncbi:hypothetical protein [Tenacibaculum xiamenense]|uniref:hypothetical protein n=1 Tax=Tenacibaculum xiamenense TaxID=1261553 RepID=UPI0038B4541E
MKPLFYIMLFLLTIACKNEKPDAKIVEPTIKESEKSIAKTSDEVTNKGTLLCKINDQNWYYTKASGLVTKNKRTDETLATITFKRRMDKKTESVQLDYDVTTKKLKNIGVSIYIEQNKLVGFKGGLQRTDYELYASDKKEPKESLSGTINTSDTKTLSGNANAVIVHSLKRLIKNKKDQVIHITDLQFSNVSYSDISNGLKF